MVVSNPIVSIDLDDTGLPPPTPEVEQERRLAIFDLLESNTFSISNNPDNGLNANGPFALLVAVRGTRLILSLYDPKGGGKGFEFFLSLNPLKTTINDYFNICDKYFDAVKRLPPGKIEAIDMARRGIHDQGGEIVLERLAGKIATDLPTARRLFTLICSLYFRE